jgi:vacuole morphology and inheritance protein 14
MLSQTTSTSDEGAIPPSLPKDPSIEDLPESVVNETNRGAAANAPSEASSLARPPIKSSGARPFPPSGGTVMHQPYGVPAFGPAASQSSSHQPPQYATSEVVSPLPPMVLRSLGDRSNEKRKNAALEIETLIKLLTESNNFATIQAIITVLSKDFCTSMNSNYRKGGLVGLAATAIGLHTATTKFLPVLLPPVLHCFDDPESRVRYYACESVYNVAKVSRSAILPYFNPIFDGLTKLFADVDMDVKNGANLLDRLIKDIVTEADSFQVDQFLPVLQSYIRRTNPYIRQLIVGWITLLDSLPDFSLLDYLPDFLDGLLNMLSDSNREIRQAADSALSDFLRELVGSQVLEFGPLISILVLQCQSKERLNRLTSITWLAELTHHPSSGGDAMLPFLPDILSAILYCISDPEKEIRLVAERTNDDLIQLVRDTLNPFELRPLLETLTQELLEKDDVPTKMASLRWINMLKEKRMQDIHAFTVNLLPVLLRTLSDPSDAVVLLDLQILSRISLPITKDTTLPDGTEEAQFQLVLNAILNLFAQDRQLLETRGSLIIRKLCVLLNAKAVYIRMAEILATYESKQDIDPPPDPAANVQFISTMVQTLNLILLTASELHDLRTTLALSLERKLSPSCTDDDESAAVFCTIFHCWCHNPIATFSLCLLAKAYDLSFQLVQRFSEMRNVTVGFLMQIDKLVHLLESPIFIHLRLQLLNVETPNHALLLKSLYGILMCLPQGEAFRLLNERLTTVCNLRDNLGVTSSTVPLDGPVEPSGQVEDHESVSPLLDMNQLLKRFDEVSERHRLVQEQRTSARWAVDEVTNTDPPSPIPTTQTFPAADPNRRPLKSTEAVSEFGRTSDIGRAPIANPS